MAGSGSRWLLIASNAGAVNRELYRFRPGAWREPDLGASPCSLPERVWSDPHLSLRARAVAERVAEWARKSG